MRSTLLALALQILATAAFGQSVVGTVTDGSTGAPIAGVLVTVLDSAAAPTTRVLTDQKGRFVLRRPAGRYTLVLEHIGFEPARRDIALAPHEVSSLAVSLRIAPVALQSIVAETRARCGRPSGDGAARLWYLARTAIASTTAEGGPLRTRRYSQELDLSLRPTTSRHHENIEISSGGGFTAARGDSLLKRGFIQERADGTYYYAPDAELLLSDDFVDGHCFGITRDPAAAGSVGLTFSPRRGGPQHDIRGALWINESSGELERIEFSFTGIAPHVSEPYAGGRVEFVRLADGRWIIPRWYVRMPRYVQRPLRLNAGTGSTRVGFSTIVSSVLETGGEVLMDATTTEDTSAQLSLLYSRFTHSNP